MRFLEIVRLELRALVRSRALALLVAVSVGWILASASIVTGDGTPDGWRELYVRTSLGGVFVLLVVTLLAAATGSIARERATKRLALTLVRPVGYFTVACGKTFALALTGAAVLALSAAVLLLRVGGDRPCHHVLAPVMPTPAEEARTMYDAYVADPSTPEAIRKAKKSLVLRILEQRAFDNYQSVPTNEVTRWRFDAPAGVDRVAVRMRFTNDYDMRQDVRGRLSFGAFSASVSNITQAVLTVPLVRSADGPAGGADAQELVFQNVGNSALMLRPRRDIALLLPADAFAANLVRAWLELVALLTFVIAFGVFLGACLARPVALFTALVLLIVGEISPSVIDQYPDALEANAIDRMGLAITRVVAAVARPCSALTPLQALSSDECVEPAEAAGALVADAIALPAFLALLAAFALPRKQEGDE